MTPTEFITRWQHASGSELANAQSFVRELAELLELPPPNPAREDTRDNDYVFERRVIFRHGDGKTSEGRIDCYKRGHFVLEAKKLKLGPKTKGFDDAMLRARSQAENYARALPAEEGRPPFLVTVDVGNVIEIYAEFSRSGATYTPFPDPRSHRIKLAELADETIRARLKAIWTDPLSLDPSRASAKATREIASKLAGIAKALETGGHDAERVAGFLTRCLFSMFAEDVGLLPKQAFSDLLDSLANAPEQFVPMVSALWKEMDVGGFSIILRQTLPRFNGKLFKSPDVLPLDRDQIGLLREAARADWTLVEPAIFGTLLERALNPDERHSLGAHYTPRPYVERLVLPTVIEPLRERWANVQAAALLYANEGNTDAALAELDTFHHELCQIRVLDPACGSANFLYVTLEHMKRLEGEVLDFARGISGGQQRLEAEGLTVDPHQFLGLELNPRAAAIAELVLWIGYLQWHFRTRSAGLPPSPILRDFKNIECRDAVLQDGQPAAWPVADFIVGNPPFIGNKRMRELLGDGYVETLRAAYPDVPESADYVMFWWHRAAQLVAKDSVKRFGLITTNSLTQTFNRRVVAGFLDVADAVDGATGDGKPRGGTPFTQAKAVVPPPDSPSLPISLVFAVPDHPWVDSADGAAVRIAMTVAEAGKAEGRLQIVTHERANGGEGLEVSFAEKRGVIHPDLNVGANIAAAQSLCANGALSSRGVIPHGAGMLVTPEDAIALEPDAPLKPYRNGKDLTDRPRGVLVIDCYGLTAEQVRERFPRLFQWLLERVKPERDVHRDKDLREKWWLHRRNNEDLRRSLSGLPRYIATGQTAKHRVFQFLDAAILPDDKLIAIALDDAYWLGVLSSRVHVIWALAAGGWLGVGNDPVYNKGKCFDAFPFPSVTPEQQARIRDLAEQLDALRKRVLADHAELTLTGLYNVLQKVGSDGVSNLSAKERVIYDKGLVAVLASFHADLDAAVLAAYGWSDIHPTDSEEILNRLVALNAERAKEEANGLIRWLRPEYQDKAARNQALVLSTPTADTTTEFGPSDGGDVCSPEPTAEGTKSATTKLKSPSSKTAWPATLPEQMALLVNILSKSPTPLTETTIAAHISGKGGWKKRLPDLLQTLVALGRTRQEGETWMAV